MLSKEYTVDLFYFNPNIHPEKEYLRRLADAKKAAGFIGVNVIECKYNPEDWFEKVRGYEQEKEGGKRCPLCFEFRLEETAKYAKEHGYDLWSTTLTVGRHKKADVINPIGERLAEEYGVEFLSRDFKKKAGFDTSIKKSNKYGLVRQHYCGCAYSLRDSKKP